MQRLKSSYYLGNAVSNYTGGFLCGVFPSVWPIQRYPARVMKFAKLLAPFREFRDGLKWRWTKRSYDKCERIEDMHICMSHVESIEPKRWQHFVLRVLARLGEAPGGNPNRDPVTGTRYAALFPKITVSVLLWRQRVNAERNLADRELWIGTSVRWRS
jgi:hypothetical protein